MSLFDSVINETREKFNLGENKANVLFSVLLGMMDKKSGGLNGFLERFNSAGLGGVASSWVNTGANTQISGEQLESALGNDTIQTIAEKTGTDYRTAISATAFMLPHLVNNLTPDGRIPNDGELYSKTRSYLTPQESSFAGVSAGNAFDRIGTSATNVIDADRDNEDILGIMDAPRPIVNKADTAVVSEVAEYDDTSPLKWLLPLAILGLLVALGFWFCSKPAEYKSANITADTINTI